jgi:hypothetical protein
MQPRADNPSLPSWLRQATFAAALGLLAAGGALFFLPALAHSDWPWDLGPFSGLFLGGIYLAALTAVGGMFYYGRWAPARLVLPMSFVFTASVFLVSVLNVDRFEWARWTSWLWFGLHLALPLALGPFLWRHRGEPPPLAYPTPDAWRRLLLTTAAVLGIYGSSLFLIGAPAAAFWPWPVDTFNAQLYGVVFSTASVGALGLAQWAAPVERLTLGVTYAMLGVFALFSVLISDAALLHVNWAAPGVWLWFALFSAVCLVGLALIWWSSGLMQGALS